MAEKRKKQSNTAEPSAAEQARPVTERRKPRLRHTRSSHPFAWLYGIVSGILMIVAVICACLIFFQVETVTVEGVSRYSTSEILAQSGIEEGQNLFFLNRTAVAEQLTKSLPYLKTVTIQRTLPGNVCIQVAECEPVAVIAVANGYWFINEDGKLLELRTSDNDLPHITGISLKTPTTGSVFTVDTAYRLKKTGLIALLTALTEQDLLDGVISIDLSDGSQLVMQYTEKYVVKIPYAADFDYRIRAMSGIIENLQETNDLEYGTIDMTLESEWHFIPN